MFELTGDHILKLNDSDLRRLVALLCEAELRRAGYPVSAVTAGGSQDAADGGLDVRVEMTHFANTSGFIPRPTVGFQVKVPDMPRSEILAEMCPKGVLRPVIAELADVSGAYIIVTAQGSATDSALQRRREAMREAVQSLPNSNALYVDFYDRERLATWVRDHPGVVVWVRETIGQPIRGWYPFANWAAPHEGIDAEYILDKKARLHDWQSRIKGPIAIEEGIQRLRRLLVQPKQKVRLVGLSGTGKTRFVQALFDERIGTDTLDRTLVIYTDLADQPDPPPRELAWHLIQNRQQALMIVDNCPPETHRGLAAICAAPEALISLLTVEYDVIDDDPEGTEVFRLEPASTDVLETLLGRRFPHISEVNRQHIAEISGGNARIAIALAGKVNKTESLANLTDQVLFSRLFYQRQSPDDSLLRAAEACSLLYSFNGESMDGEDSELSLLAELAGLSVDELYRKVQELYSRELVQRRGPWRAVLPQAIANRLARQALERIPPARIQSVLLDRGSDRMWRSFSRRIGHLHDCEPVQKIVDEWLSPRGVLFDVAQLNSFGSAILLNVAPVNPTSVLDVIEKAATGSSASSFLSVSNNQRHTWISLLGSIAYEPSLFFRTCLLIARFMIAEPEGNNDQSARSTFTSLFHLHLSGTQASIDQRLKVVNALLDSPDIASQTCGFAALSALLQTSLFSGGGFEFGSRPRDYGWYPKTRGEVVEWYRSVLDYAQNQALMTCLVGEKVRSILAETFRALWVNIRIFDELEAMAKVISGQYFWPEGWITVRNTIRYHSKNMPPDIEKRLRDLENTMSPSDLLEQVQAYVFSKRWGSLDIADGDSDAQKDALESDIIRAEDVIIRLGREVAANHQLFAQILPDLVRRKAERGWEFGQGLAAGSNDLIETWQRLVTVLATTLEQERSIQTLRGFLHSAQARDAHITANLLDSAITDPVLGFWFPFLQASVTIGEQGGRRLEAALQAGMAPTWTYNNSLAMGNSAGTIPPPMLRRIVQTIASLPDGYEVAVEILSTRLHSIPNDEGGFAYDLIQCGRELVHQLNFSRSDFRLDYELSKIFEVCFAGTEAVDGIVRFCHNIKQALLEYRISVGDFPYLLSAIFRLHVSVALDELLGDTSVNPKRLFVGDFELNRDDLLHHIPEQTLLSWAQVDPYIRFPRLATAITPFASGHSNRELTWTPLALQILTLAPDRVSVLEAFGLHLVPTSWSGSLAAILEDRRSLLNALMSHSDSVVVTWAQAQDTKLERLAALERKAERREDESFE